MNKNLAYRNVSAQTVCLVAVVGLAASVAPIALAQDAKPAVPPAAQPADKGYTAPDATADGDKYLISRFLLEYEFNNAEHPDLKDIFSIPVKVGVLADGGFTLPREGLPVANLTVGDAFGEKGQLFYQGGIAAVTSAIADDFSINRKLVGISVQVHPEDFDWQTGEDKRGNRTGLRLKIFTAQVVDSKIIQMTPGTDEEERVNPERLSRIRMMAPLNAGNLVRRDVLDDYILKLNRHSGRRVNAAIVPSSEEAGLVEVQYQISEAKPWSIYTQFANIGTKTTDEWRERFGFVHTQLTDSDDIFRLDYLTAGFGDTNTAFGSYERPIFDEIKLKAYASWGQYSADSVGFANETFEGENWSLGAELQGNLYQNGPFFLDWVVGARYENITVNNTVILQKGEGSFFLPYAGVRVDRVTDQMSSGASAIVEFAPGGITNTEASDLTSLGRIFPDEDWATFKYEFEHSMYLEPLFLPKAFKDRDEQVRGATLAHEVAFSLRGQDAFGKRLTPTFEGVAGGFYSVRGYPESVAAGDNSVVATLEYRFHFPRTLLTTDKEGRPTYMDPSKSQMFGRPFRVGPAQAFDRTDWDLIFRGFLDMGRTWQSDKQVFESDQTLIGAGVGVELQFLQNVQLRMDLGFAMHDVDGTETVDAGDSKLHFSATFLY